MMTRFLCLLVATAGCADRATPSSPIKPADLTPDETRVFSAKDSGRVEKHWDINRLASQAQGVLEIPAEDMRTVGWFPEEVERSDGPVVLFVEPNQRPVSALGRFRSQMLGRFRFDGEVQEFREDLERYELPARYMTLSRLYEGFFPPLERVPFKIQDLLDVRALNPFGTTFVYHGTFVFDLFATRSPGMKYIFADLSELDILDCPAGTGRQEAWTNLKDKAERTEQAWRRFVDDHRVSHVVLTHAFLGGDPISSLREELNRRCPALKFKSREVFSTLMHIRPRALDKPELRVFQALSNYPNQIESRQEWEMLCPKQTPFFRVGYFSTPETAFPREGWPLAQLRAPRGQESNWTRGCAQVVVNSGFGERQRIDPETGLTMTVPEFGIEHLGMRAPIVGALTDEADHEWLMANSWATPLAAAFSVHLEANFRSQKGRNPTLAELQKLLVGRAFDPILHNQFEVYYEGVNQ